jgi:ATP-dependent Clp protease adapter protein ClpS
MSQRGTGGGTKSGGGSGGTALDSRVKQEVKSSLKDEIEKDYRLILHDDTVHTIQQVCEILGKNCPLCPGPRAYEVTLETHMSGAATVAVANKKIVEEVFSLYNILYTVI